MKPRYILGMALALLLVLSGCGYRLYGTGTALPPHLKTLAVPVFENTSGEPIIHRQLTDTIRRAFLTDGRIQLVDDADKANLVLSGKLDFYDIRAVAFDTNDVATEYWVYLGIDVVATDRVKKKPYFQEKFRTRWDYRPNTSVVSSEANRQAALEEAYRDVAIRLVSLVVDQF